MPKPTAPKPAAAPTIAARQAREAEAREIRDGTWVPSLDDIATELSGRLHQTPAAPATAKDKPQQPPQEPPQAPAEGAIPPDEPEEPEAEGKPQPDAPEEPEAGGEPQPDEPKEPEAGGEPQPDEPKEPEAEPTEAERIRDAMQRRIDKLTARVKELETKTGPETPAAGPQPQPARETPAAIATAATSEAVDQIESDAHAVRLWAIENLDGVEIAKPGGETVYYEPAQVRAIMANAERVLRAAPQRRQFLAARQQAEQEFDAAYPDFKKPGAAKELFDGACREIAGLGDIRPDFRLIVADALLGKAERIRRTRETKKPAAQPPAGTPAPPRAPRPNQPPRIPAKAAAATRQTGSLRAALGSPAAVLAAAESLVS